jgi:hypothetical protein
VDDLHPSSFILHNSSFNPARLWFVLLAGPVSWSVLFLAVYLLNELSCNLGYLLAEMAGLRVSAVISLALTAVTLAIILYAGYLAYGIRQHAEPGREAREEEKTNNTYFIGLSGLLLSILFALLTLSIGAALLLSRPC